MGCIVVPRGCWDFFFAKDFFYLYTLYTLLYSTILMIMQYFTTNHPASLQRAIYYLNTND